MNYKMIWILFILLLAGLTIGVACASDNNVTCEVISIENAQNNETAALDVSNGGQIIENDTDQNRSDEKQI